VESGGGGDGGPGLSDEGGGGGGGGGGQEGEPINLGGEGISRNVIGTYHTPSHIDASGYRGWEQATSSQRFQVEGASRHGYVGQEIQEQSEGSSGGGGMTYGQIAARGGLLVSERPIGAGLSIPEVPPPSWQGYPSGPSRSGEYLKRAWEGGNTGTLSTETVHIIC